MAAVLPLNDIVNVIINLSPRSAARIGFNLSILLGDSPVLSKDNRVAVYSSLASMEDAGFRVNMPEYKAAQIYFGQQSHPGRVAIGYWDSENETLAVAISACRTANREWYGVVPLGKISFPTEAQYIINAKNLDFSENLAPNTTYRIQFGLNPDASVSITTGAELPKTDEEFVELFTGTNFTLNGKIFASVVDGRTITYTAESTGESTPIGLNISMFGVDSFSVEYEINVLGFSAVFINGIDVDGKFANPTMADILNAAPYIEAAEPASVMFAAVDLSTMKTLKSMNYRRSLGVVTEDIMKPVGILGWAMGANTGLANSAYTLKFKNIVGVQVDPLTEAQVSDALVANGNVYINRGATYDWLESGTMADGTWFDEMINLDMLANYIQLSISDLLNKVPKVPQTEAGVLQIINSFIPDLEKAVRTGFVAAGIWTAPGFLTLSQGDAIEKGYLVLSEAINDQSPADREARMAPPIYIAVKLAGAIHSAIIQVNVNR